MNIAGWVEVATYQKVRNSKIRDTFRVFVNELGWCKGHSDKTGKDFYFESLSSLIRKVEALEKIRYKLHTGELPDTVVSRYAVYTEDI